MIASTTDTSVLYPHLANYSIADIRVPYFPPDEEEATMNPDPPFATECTLCMCVHTYQANVSAGVSHEAVVSSWPTNSTSKQDLLTSFHGGWTTQKSVVSQDSPIFELYESSWTVTPPGDTTTYYTTTYSTTDVTLNALRQWTQDVLTGSVLSVSDTPSPSLDVVNFIYYAVVNNNAGLTPVMQQVASSLTKSSIQLDNKYEDNCERTFG